MKAAANEGAALVVCSQVNKDAQKGTLGQTAFAGADLARMPDAAFTIEKALYESGSGAFSAAPDGPATRFPGLGEARLVRVQKKRGFRPLKGGDEPRHEQGLWIRQAALHDHSAEAPKRVRMQA